MTDDGQMMDGKWEKEGVIDGGQMMHGWMGGWMNRWKVGEGRSDG